MRRISDSFLLPQSVEGHRGEAHDERNNSEGEYALRHDVKPPQDKANTIHHLNIWKVELWLGPSNASRLFS